MTLTELRRLQELASRFEWLMSSPHVGVAWWHKNVDEVLAKIKETELSESKCTCPQRFGHFSNCVGEKHG